MGNTCRMLAAAAIAAAAIFGCSEGTAPSSDQAPVLAAEGEQLGAMVDSTFGESGALPSAAVLPAGAGSAQFSVVGSMAADTVPTFWGRVRVVPGGPRPIYHRDVTIQGDTARVEHDLTFTGILLVDTSADGVFNPTSKPLADRMTQRAVLVRDGAMRHGWRVVELSPQDWTVVDPARQTIAV